MIIKKQLHFWKWWITQWNLSISIIYSHHKDAIWNFSVVQDVIFNFFQSSFQHYIYFHSHNLQYHQIVLCTQIQCSLYTNMQQIMFKDMNFVNRREMHFSHAHNAVQPFEASGLQGALQSPSDSCECVQVPRSTSLLYYHTFLLFYISRSK